MTIGTSLGAFYPDKMSFLTAPYKGGDNNVIDPDTTPDLSGTDNIDIKKPNNPPVEVEVGKKDEMPFPNNTDVSTNFVNRFGNLPPSGILNDIKPQSPDKPLIRKIADVRGIDKSPMLPDVYGGGGNLRIPESIKSAALKIDGELFEGENHGYALGKWMDKNPGKDISKNWEDGFTTTNGRFVSREEAFDLAKQSNQIKPEVLPSLTHESTQLLSEDMDLSGQM